MNKKLYLYNNTFNLFKNGESLKNSPELFLISFPVKGQLLEELVFFKLFSLGGSLRILATQMCVSQMNMRKLPVWATTPAWLRRLPDKLPKDSHTVPELDGEICQPVQFLGTVL